MDVSSAGLRDIYTWDIRRGSALRLTNEPGEEFFAEWSPFGDSLYYSSNQLGGAFNIFRRAADGTGRAELVFQSAASQMLAHLTRDGTRIVVEETRIGSDGFDLMTLVLQAEVRLDTLLSTPNREYNASVSPDGRLVAYQSNLTGQEEVYVSPMSGAALARWKVSVDGGEKPLWSVTGDTIFYRSPADSMMAAIVATTPGFAVSKVSGLFAMRFSSAFGTVSGREWDLSRVDGRFLLARRPPPAPSGVRVVLNWTQELLRAMEPL